MCGLAGVARRESRGVATEMLDRMAGALRHRGPDATPTRRSVSRTCG